MTKKVLLILAPGFEEIEAVTCVDILRRAGLEVTVAGLGDRTVEGSRGLVILADKKLDEAGLDFDACVLPGGMPGAANLASSRKVNELIQKMNAEKKIIAAICASPALVLAPAGILKDKAAACYPGMENNFGRQVRYSQEDVVIDGHIITSRGPATALMFALAVAERLAGKKTADQVREAVLLPPA